MLARRCRRLALAGAPLGLSILIAPVPASGQPLPNLGRLGAESIPRDKPSDLLCGSGSRPKPRRGPGGCRHKAPHGGLAQEGVEVRGWVSWVAPGSNNGDPDYHYDLRLDPDHPPTVISGPRKGTTIPLSLVLHPANLVEAAEEGERRLRGFRHPRNDDVYVGNNLKVEIHGWSRSRWGAVPLDWIAADDVDGDPDVFWPFHPLHPLDFQSGDIRVGDYVRLVGTLWEDEPHGHGRCWDGRDEGGHGYYELHPVNFMGRIDGLEPSPPLGTGEIIAACGAGEVEVEIRPPGSRPDGMVARYDETVRVREDTTRVVSLLGDRIRVKLDVGDRFWAYYRVYWGPPLPTPAPRPRRCGSGERCCERGDDGGCLLCVSQGQSCR